MRFGFYKTLFKYSMYANKRTNLIFNINLPYIYNFVLLQSSSIYIYAYTLTYKFFLNLGKYYFSFHFDVLLKILFFQLYIPKPVSKLFLYYLSNFLYSLYSFFFKKFKIKGKYYRIRISNNKTINFKFGHSHRIYSYTYFLLLMQLTKKLFFCIFINFQNSINILLNIYKKKITNKYTQRGIAIHGILRYKRPGKVSIYR